MLYNMHTPTIGGQKSVEGYVLFGVILAAGLAFIPANIARKKGYSYGLWWFYGWMLFIVAIIHVSLIEDKNAPQKQPVPVTQLIGVADEIKKYKELFDQGILTESQYQEKKEQLLKLGESSEKPAACVQDTSEDYQNGWLNYYFDLLNKGVITQEEFETKKKQILGV